MKKKHYILTIISFILLIFMVIGVSYAAYKFSAAGTKENVISTGTISMSYKQNSFIDLKNTYPKTDIYAIGTKEDKSSMEFSVSMETSGTTTINYVLALTEIQEGETLKSDKVKIYLEKEGKVVNNFETNKGQTIESFKNKYVEGLIDNYAIYQDILTTSKETHNYTLTAWIDESYILPIKNETTTTKQTNEETYKFKVKVVGVDSPITIEEKEAIILDTSGANAPVLASNMIPVYYDEANSVWKKADASNTNKTNPWYSYNSTGEYKGMWANAVTVKDTNRQTYLNATPGTVIPMDDITTMWVWIPRFNAVGNYETYNGTNDILNPGAFDITYTKLNEPSLDAFTFGDKELSGFWFGKFSISHTTLASSTTDDNLGCTNETCSNANGIIIKPNVKSLHYNRVSKFFYASRSMEQTGNSFGFVSSEVDTHMSKNNEWMAVAYLTQSIYGRCISSTNCPQMGINNNSNYITGYGAPAKTAVDTNNGAYNTALGKDASTTGTIYGIYDMAGGSEEYVMRIIMEEVLIGGGQPTISNKDLADAGFEVLPNEKYYNTYLSGLSQPTEDVDKLGMWYIDTIHGTYHLGRIGWFYRSGTGLYNLFDPEYMTLFIYNRAQYETQTGTKINNFSSRFVITNE